MNSPFNLPPSLSRRHFLSGALATAALPQLGWAQPTADGSTWVLLGTQDGEGVYRARWNSRTGELGAPELAAPTSRPTYLALHPRLPVLYACNELEGEQAGISAFQVNHQQGTLQAAAHQATQGNSPCFVSVDRTGKLLFAADYGGGSLSVFPLGAQGELRPLNDLFACAKSTLCGHVGPVAARQDAAHLHCATFSPDNRAVLACDLGDDAILIFELRPDAMPPVAPPQRIAARPGSGPRHIAFHPRGDVFYCVHELDCTVDAFRWHPHGAAEAIPDSVVHLAPLAAAGATPNTAAEVAVSRDGRFVYTSVRGVDQLTVLAVDGADRGKLKIEQQLPCGGAMPRFFSLDPTERWLLCAHQTGNSVTVFARDAKTGRLSAHGTYPMPSPMCIVWL